MWQVRFDLSDWEKKQLRLLMEQGGVYAINFLMRVYPWMRRADATSIVKSLRNKP